MYSLYWNFRYDAKVKDEGSIPSRGTMNTFQKMLVAYRNGIKNPYLAWQVSKDTGLPFYALCAVLEIESNGGQNVFGHDGGPTGWASGWGYVTKAKYLRYKEGRKAGKGMQGVGPMQLTYWSIQDKADARGGCWKPKVNMTVGAELLYSYWKQSGNWKDAGTRYNGSSYYGTELAAKVDKWKNLLN